MDSFPKAIECWQVDLSNECIAGVVLFNHGKVRHLQYTSANHKGKPARALDLLINQVLTDSVEQFEYLSMGTSIDPETQLPHKGLTHWKNSWGALTFPSTVYELDLKAVQSTK